MITRDLKDELIQSAAEYPVVTILGPRQSGKTTLAKAAFSEKPYFSLEYPDTRMTVEADPRGFLGGLPDGAVLDEIQRLPDILSYLQGMVDRDDRPGRFILTGSHQPRLHEAIAQSLAGRTAVLTLWPLSFDELRRDGASLDAFDLIVRGFFPRLHRDGLDPRRFFNGYLQTYVERDVRAMIQLHDLAQFQKFLVLLAGRVGQVVNFTSLSNDVGVSGTTIKNWLSVLKASFVVFELPPFFGNIQKRLIKSPKIYFTDVGMASFLLGIHTREQALRDPLRGNLYENLVIADLVKSAFNKGIRPEVYFFRDSHGNEVDLVIREKGHFVPIEIKSAETFSMDFTRGIDRFNSLDVDRISSGAIFYNGARQFDFKGMKVLNPLVSNGLWNTLTLDTEPVRSAV